MIGIPSLLFLDLKTSGLYLKSEPIASDQQPWAPYISALQCDETGRIVNMMSTFVKPNGRSVKHGALEKHGIDHKVASRIGIPESRALGMLSDMLKVGPFDDSMKVITYGDMDVRVLSSLFARFALSLDKPPHTFDRLWMTRPMTTFIDLQKPYAQHVCCLTSDADEGDFRWPTFSEACQSVLGRMPTNSMDSLEEILLIKDLYFDFARRGYFGGPVGQ